MDKQQVLNQLLEKRKKQEALNALLERDFSPEDARAIKKRISDYFFEKLTKSFEEQALEEGWTESTYKEWANEHIRTPYEQA